MRRPTYPPAPCEPRDDFRPRYPARRTMNAVLGQRYEGPDTQGQPVGGVILHVGNYAADGSPATYVLELDSNGHRGQTAIVSADDVKRHLDGLSLCDSMEADRE